MKQLPGGYTDFREFTHLEVAKIKFNYMKLRVTRIFWQIFGVTDKNNDSFQVSKTKFLGIAFTIKNNIYLKFQP